MKILVADDEIDIRNLIRIDLEEERYEVKTAKNGREVLDLLKAQRFDLAILDVMMPVLDGFNLLRIIRKDNNMIPVIFLTARGDDMDKVLGLGLGADDYVVKPFSLSELKARVSAHLRRSKEYVSQKTESSIITYKDLSINKDNCGLYKNGELIVLGAKEYKLVLYFMENPEKIFTKRQLYQAVWEGEYYEDDNTVMVHMSKVRNKIEDDPQNPVYLKTIRGIGYKLHYTGETV